MTSADGGAVGRTVSVNSRVQASALEPKFSDRRPLKPAYGVPPVLMCL